LTDIGSPDLSGHLAWAFNGPAEFEVGAISFLTAGQGKGERLLFISASPDADRFPADLLEGGALRLASTGEVYGRRLDADAQRDAFVAVLEEALAEGYSGLRVAADNTPLVADPDLVDAWVRWEITAEDFMATSPVTGLCGFDRQRIDPRFLRFVTGLHSGVVRA
jgi:hypothetical protein